MALDAEVLAICVNWNGREVLGTTLQALLASTHRPLSVSVVDNASTDASPAEVPGGVELVKMPENGGYGAAINRIWREVLSGARRAPAYYLLLNNDVRVDRRMVEQLVEFARGRPPAVFGPKVLSERRPERLDMAWGELRWSHVLTRFRGKRARDGPRWSRVREVPVLQGSVLLVDARLVQEVGLFDETYFMYHEEVDFMHRAAVQGYKSYYFPFARAWHRGAHSTAGRPLQKIFWVRRNTVYFMKKHRASPAQWAWFTVTLGSSLIYNLLSLRWERTRTILKGVRTGFEMVPEPTEPAASERTRQ